MKLTQHIKAFYEWMNSPNEKWVKVGGQIEPKQYKSPDDITQPLNLAFNTSPRVIRDAALPDAIEPEKPWRRA